MKTLEATQQSAVKTEHCAHCGDPCPNGRIHLEDTYFCCQGCKSIYQILQEGGLLDFYRLDERAGKSQAAESVNDYAWLEVPKLAESIVRYRDETRCQIEIELPAIHCVSCVWLLERLPDLCAGVGSCTIDFNRKKAFIVFDPGQLALREIMEILAKIGYPPHLKAISKEEKRGVDRSMIYRLGVAGFCFGNIMLLSFPEYLGWGADLALGNLGTAVNYLMLLLSLPVLLYAGKGFFTATYYALAARRITIDLPIVIGMVALFVRSAYEILAATGAGYLDSLAGLVFFLLIGRWFQSYTFARLNFDRDYQDYFPIAANKLLPTGGSEPVASEDLAAGDRILVKPGQLIPADGRLLNDALSGIDYSFVTGESDPQPALADKAVFAGGRAVTSALAIEVTKPAAQSYLLQLWLKEGEGSKTTEVGPPEKFTQFFTAAILLLALGTFAYWYGTDAAAAYRAATAVLIIACPCALALAAPFAYGTLQRHFARFGYYFRGTAVIQRLGQIDTFVFDKTGTLANNSVTGKLVFVAQEMEPAHAIFRGMCSQSSHPLSQALEHALNTSGVPAHYLPPVEEMAGKGLQLRYLGHDYTVGSAVFCGLTNWQSSGGTFCCKDGELLLYLDSAPAQLRTGVAEMLEQFQQQGPAYLLSGDHAPATAYWENHLPPANIHFQQSPFDKLDFIHSLNAQGKQVLMVGDGLNDAGALRTASVGLAVNEDEASFNPACDGIIQADQLALLPWVHATSRKLRYVLYLTHGLALFYNLIGLSYAVTGTLSPIVAAILMPLSSITIVVIATVGALVVGRRVTF